MNHLQNLAILNNRYLVMRHGESLANQQGLIVSSAENGVADFGLSNKGRDQIKKSINTNPNVANVTKIISSDFKRAQESAEIVHHLLKDTSEIKFNENLRERLFGDFELSTNEHYQTVWDHDAVNSAHTFDNVESTEAVMKRVTSLVLSLEKEFADETFLLVSHGDTLQILQSAFKRSPASEHRQMPHLNTSEIRELFLST